MTIAMIIIGIIIWIVLGLVLVATIIDAPDNYREWVTHYPNKAKRFSILFIGGPFIWFFIGSSMTTYLFQEHVIDKIELLKIWLKK